MLGAQTFRPRIIGETPHDGQRAPLVAGCILTDIPIPGCYRWLTAAESARAAAMRSALRRAQFVAGRWLLHGTAVEVFGAGGYTFETVGERPVLHAPPPGSPASCSISHSARVVLCAAGRTPACGIDIEVIRPRRDLEALCARVCHASEWERVRSAPEDERWRRFYEIWVVKEALAKALGVGLALPFREIAVSADARLEEVPAGLGNAKAWRVRALAAGEGLAAALAWREIS